MSEKIRLQKTLSLAGLGSRREMERWISEGLVKVNDKQAQIGDKVDDTDKIMVKGRLIKNPLTKSQNTRILLYNKPVGEISSRNDPKHSKTVFDNLPTIQNGRWVQVGRLDINTSGLMIFTNNGELANQLMHPKFEVEREYAVRVRGDVSERIIQSLKKGVELEDGIAKFEKIDFRGGESSNSWYHVVISEGRNREVRRLWASQGIDVSRLIRVRYGKIHLPRYLARGQSKELSPSEVESLLKALQFKVN
tara:strand:+ start:338 stop:1087 length:750 start_codon:yes stop_codon:yes gene_type:complete